MSQPKFMVFNLKDLKISLIVLAIVVATFSIFLLSRDSKVTTFAPTSTYENGTYIANIALSDASLDLVVDVSNNLISSVSLQNFDASERAIYEDINSSISFVNDYVTSTQNTELPDTNNFSVGTSLLMDAVQIALSEDDDARLISTYQTPLLEKISPEESSEGLFEESFDESPVISD